MASLSKSVLSDRSIATPAFFSYLFAWNIFSIPSLFLCRSFVLRWVSCRQYTVHVFLSIQPTLGLLIGAFNPFTFKVIIDSTDSLFLLCTSVPLSLTLFPHLLKSVPLACLAELVWWRCILAFFCLGNSLFCLPF